MMSAIMAQMMRRCLRRLSGLGRRYLLLIETSITQSLYCTLSTQGLSLWRFANQIALRLTAA